MTHHPAILQFPPASAQDADFASDFTGARFRRSLGYTPGASFPKVNEEYFEWISLLESVLAARDRYVFVELGAGYGRWSARAACAARRRGIGIHVVAVEAEPVHFRWLRQTLCDNGLGAEEKTEIQAAVADQSGMVQFYVRPDSSSPDGLNAETWYGQAVAKPDTIESDEGEYEGWPMTGHISGAGSISVPAVSLAEILEPFAQVDLVDMDIQGEELAVIRSAVDVLAARVKRIHVGTHSTENEVGIREVMNGWDCLADYPCGSVSRTPWGEVSFEDGVQVWRNRGL